MASITVRNIDERVKQALRMKAAENGRSMEEQLRHLLETAAEGRAARPLDLAEEFVRRFDPLGGIEITPFAIAGQQRRLFWEDDEAQEKA